MTFWRFDVITFKRHGALALKRFDGYLDSNR
jgi:hypothetical protein